MLNTETIGKIAPSEVRRLSDRLFLVGEHQFAVDALVCFLTTQYLKPRQFDLNKKIWIYHVDAHSDMSAGQLYDGPKSTWQRVFEDAQNLRSGRTIDTMALLETKGGRNSYVTYLAQIGLVDKVIFVANLGYEFEQSRKAGILPESIARFDGLAVPVETYDLDNFPKIPDNTNIYWSIDTDILAFGFGRSNHRISNDDVTVKTVSELQDGLKKRGLDIKDQNQCAVVSQDYNAFNHRQIGKLVGSLVTKLQSP